MVGARFFAPVQTGLEGPPSLMYSVNLVAFPRVKRRECGVNHPTPFSAEGEERVELYLYSPSGTSWPILG